MFHTSDGRKVIENLDEFDDAREVVSSLAAEYLACEQPDYVSHNLPHVLHACAEYIHLVAVCNVSCTLFQSH